MINSKDRSSSAAAREELLKYSDPIRAAHSLRYFKTGPGEYGEGDEFMGATVPQVRKVAAQFVGLDNDQVVELLKEPIHEMRLMAVIIWTNQFAKGDETKRQELYNSYLENTQYINNWDLVDSSAHKIVGAYLFDKDRSILYELAKSEDMWERRISMMSTAYFIGKNDYSDTLELAELLLHDKEDLIHKVVGWMLREVGKRNFELETAFLDEHYNDMPRTMLRYSIEKYPEDMRQQYLRGTR